MRLFLVYTDDDLCIRSTGIFHNQLCRRRGVVVVVTCSARGTGSKLYFLPNVIEHNAIEKLIIRSREKEKVEVLNIYSRMYCFLFYGLYTIQFNYEI